MRFPSLSFPTPASVVGAARSVVDAAAGGIADVGYFAVGVAVTAPADLRSWARRAATAVGGDRAGCQLVGCEHGPAFTAGRWQGRVCRWCGASRWETATVTAAVSPAAARPVRALGVGRVAA